MKFPFLFLCYFTFGTILALEGCDETTTSVVPDDDCETESAFLSTPVSSTSLEPDDDCETNLKTFSSTNLYSASSQEPDDDCETLQPQLSSSLLPSSITSLPTTSSRIEPNDCSSDYVSLSVMISEPGDCTDDEYTMSSGVLSEQSSSWTATESFQDNQSSSSTHHCTHCTKLLSESSLQLLISSSASSQSPLVSSSSVEVSSILSDDDDCLKYSSASSSVHSSHVQSTPSLSSSSMPESHSHGSKASSSLIVQTSLLPLLRAQTLLSESVFSTVSSGVNLSLSSLSESSQMTSVPTSTGTSYSFSSPAASLSSAVIPLESSSSPSISVTSLSSLTVSTSKAISDSHLPSLPSLQLAPSAHLPSVSSKIFFPSSILGTSTTELVEISSESSTSETCHHCTPTISSGSVDSLALSSLPSSTLPQSKFTSLTILSESSVPLCSSTAQCDGLKGCYSTESESNVTSSVTSTDTRPNGSMSQTTYTESIKFEGHSDGSTLSEDKSTGTKPPGTTTETPECSTCGPLKETPETEALGCTTCGIVTETPDCTTCGEIEIPDCTTCGTVTTTTQTTKNTKSAPRTNTISRTPPLFTAYETESFDHHESEPHLLTTATRTCTNEICSQSTLKVVTCSPSVTTVTENDTTHLLTVLLTITSQPEKPNENLPNSPLQRNTDKLQFGTHTPTMSVSSQSIVPDIEDSTFEGHAHVLSPPLLLAIFLVWLF